MKIIKKNLVYLFILFLVGGGYFLYTKKIEKEKEEKKLIEKKIFFIPEEKVSYVSIKNGEKKIECFKEKGKWKIKPGNFDADSNEIKNLIDNILKIEKERKLEGVENLDEFGLGKKNKKITVGNSGEKFSLIIGEETPTGSYYYGTTDNKNIFLVSKWNINDIIEKNVFDLRDKRIIPAKIEKEKIEKIEIKKGRNRYVIERKNKKWEIIYPLKDLADKNEVENIISDILEKKVKSFEKKETEISTSAYIKISSEGKEYSLFLGKEKDGKIFAKNSIKPWVFTIDKEILDDIPESIDDLREKDVFTFEKENVVAVEIENKNGKFTLIKKDNGWRIEKSKKKISKEKVDNFLDDLKFIEIDKFLKFSKENLKKYGLLNPDVKVTVILPENRKESIYTGKREKEKVFCFLPERNVIITILKDNWKILNKKESDFFEKKGKK
ncbi:MAG: hypothetical protein DRI88_13395 [Bacteroidetes bacterium]|nr:MAG: hypothetical protein DRI88_13395 [Bacteroidota bacterium]